MKKILALFLIIILFFNLAGAEILFSIMLEQCRYESEEILSKGIKNDHEVLLIIDSVNQKLVHRFSKKEIEYKGIMYDIRKEERNGTIILIYAYMDSEEGSLRSNFNSENSDSNPVKNGKSAITSKYISPFCLTSLTSMNIPLISFSLRNEFIEKKYHQPDIELKTPPPQS